MASTITVAQARGVMMLVLAQNDVPFVEFTPAQIKQALTGWGNTDKCEVQQVVAKGVEFRLHSSPGRCGGYFDGGADGWISCRSY